jgi:hypothetical protein
MAAPAYAFISPDESLQSLEVDKIHERLGLRISSGHRANLGFHSFSEPLLGEIVGKLKRFKKGYEDQCTAKYYADLFQCVRDCAGSITRVIEVGCFMGGASVILAGCGQLFDQELDIVDVNDKALRFSFERIRRCFPEYAGRVRLFHGDLPTYVRDVFLKEQEARALLQHDGSHHFDQVVRDLSALSFVRERIHAITIQDTHLRGYPEYCNFVDAAAYAIFGFDMKFTPIGSAYTPDQTELLAPNPYQGNYFMPNMPEGWFIPLDQNQFRYPHPAIPLEAFIHKTKT